jgi:hypothetical protein
MPTVVTRNPPFLSLLIRCFLRFLSLYMNMPLPTERDVMELMICTVLQRATRVTLGYCSIATACLILQWILFPKQISTCVLRQTFLFSLPFIASPLHPFKWNSKSANGASEMPRWPLIHCKACKKLSLHFIQSFPGPSGLSLLFVQAKHAITQEIMIHACPFQPVSSDMGSFLRFNFLRHIDLFPNSCQFFSQTYASHIDLSVCINDVAPSAWTQIVSAH